MKIIKFAALLGLIAITGHAWAEAAFESIQDVQGQWRLEYTKKSIDTKETIKREDTWAFNDGKVTITNIPREGSYYDQLPVKYEIEDGKLKIALLGRSDRFDTFSLIEKDEKSMTLKGKYGDIYYFKKQ